MLLELTENGLYCPAGDFYVDPWQPVPRAILTHAHADHARPGAGRYLAARAGEPLVRYRLGADISLETVPYGETVSLNGVLLGYLSRGPNNRLNGGDTFAIPASQQLAGTNQLLFEQARSLRWKWGVTNLLVDVDGAP